MSRSHVSTVDELLEYARSNDGQRTIFISSSKEDRRAQMSAVSAMSGSEITRDPRARETAKLMCGVESKKLSLHDLRAWSTGLSYSHRPSRSNPNINYKYVSEADLDSLVERAGFDVVDLCDVAEGDGTDTASESGLGSQQSGAMDKIAKDLAGIVMLI
jgi:hypothetical protein